ncbi:hypothetical protein [Neotabrizicola sp. VNH66]|uniref:hypothetical protein n=1 Tax=Neotabrizicola sp. VNH66 TaxID=3400918 RepID=UPI003C00A281
MPRLSPKLAALAMPLALILAGPAAAQALLEPFAPTGETTRASGPYSRYLEHIMKLSPNRYAVLFRPGYVDAATAIRAVAPLCAAQGRSATGIGTVAPVDVVLDDTGMRALLGYRVDCK